MWPFTKKPEPLPPGKKLSLYDVRDFPKDRYSAYPEIGVSNTAPYKWRARMISRASPEVLAEAAGEAESEEAARRASQSWVLEQFPRFERKPQTVDAGGLA